MFAGLASVGGGLGVRVATADDVPVGETEKEAPKKSVDAAAVYFGDPKEWEKPAAVDADAVYAEIEEYRQVRDEKLEESDARYAVLMTKANKRFRAAVRKAAKDGGYDLVAKVGAVQGVDSVPTITAKVVENL